jgi:hypothetical protein
VVEHFELGGACLKVVPLAGTCGSSWGHPERNLVIQGVSTKEVVRVKK